MHSNESHNHFSNRLDCPIIAMGANDDVVVPPQKMSGWAKWTTKYSIILPVQGGGGHLFVKSNPESVGKVIVRFIRMHSSSSTCDVASSSSSTTTTTTETKEKEEEMMDTILSTIEEGHSPQ